MQRLRAPLASLATLAALTTCLPAPATAQTATRSSVKASQDLLPPGVLVHVSIPSVDAFRERFRNSHTAGLFQEEGLQELKSKVLEKIEEAAEELESNTDFTLEELLNIASGEVAFALVQPPGEGLAGVLMVDFGDSEETVNKIVDMISEATEQNGGSVDDELIEGTEVHQLVVDEDSPVNPELLSFNYFIKDDVWVMGSNKTVLGEVLARWNSDAGQAFSGEEIYQDIATQIDLGTGRPPAMSYFVDPIGLLRAGIQTAAENIPEAQQAQMVLGFLPLTGLDNLLGMGGATDFDVDGYESVMKQFIRVDRPTSGLLKVFSFATADHAPPAWVSEDVAGYTSFKWNVEEAYSAIETLVDQFQGRGATKKFLDQISEMPDGPGIHPKDDVLDQINGLIRIVQRGVEVDPENLEGMSQRMTLAIGLEKNSSLPDTITSLVETAGGGEVETRDFQGVTVYEFEIPDQGTAGFAVVEDQLVFSTALEDLQEMIRGPERGLADSAEFRKATNGFPRTPLALSYASAAQSLEPFYELVRSGVFTGEIDRDDFDYDFTELPPFSDLAKYFGASAGYTVETDDGTLSVTRQIVE